VNGLVLNGQNGLPTESWPDRNGPRHLPAMRYAIGIARSKWKLGAGVAAAAFLLIVIGGILMPHGRYAQALLVIHPIAQNLAQPTDQQAVLPPDTSAIDTEVEVLRSPSVAETMVRKLKLYQDPEFGGQANAQPSDALVKKVVSAVEARSTIRRIGLTYAVQVGFTASTYDKAQRIANGLSQAYLQRKLDEKLANVSQANRDLGSTLGDLRQQALDAESRVEQYKAANHLLGSEASASTETELSGLDQRISDARADSAAKMALLAAAVEQSKSGAGTADLNAQGGTGTVGALRQKEAELSATLAQLETEFQSDYPLVQKTKAELDAIRVHIRSETNRIVSGLRSEAAAAARKEESLMASRKQTEDLLASNNKARVGLLTLEQSAQSSKKIYETYLTRASEVAVARSLQRVDASVESKAMPMASSVFSDPKIVLLMAILAAMIAATMAIALSEMWSSRVRSWNDVVRVTGMPLAGFLPDVGPSDVGDPTRHIANQPLTAFAEAFRNLRAYLTLSAKPGHAKVIAVTSAVPGEGKTLVSACLARTLAASGLRVVLLDCDLRKASASKLFARPRFGVVEVVSNSVPIERALAFDSAMGIWYLSGHSKDSKIADLFSTERIEELLQTLAQRFDRIIIDTPPLLGFADARLFAAKADQVLYVIQWNKTSASTVHAAVEILRQCCGRGPAAVLNRVDVKQQARYGFADGSDYYHHYGAAYAQQL